ncbi:hypothetical protein Tco_1389312 [Tanacetum coccineum]
MVESPFSKFKKDKVRMLLVQVHKPKRRRDATWFKEKVLLVQAHAEGKELDEEQLAFLADPKVADAKAVLMANLSSCDSDVISEAIVQNTNTSAQQNSMILSMFEQMSNHATNCDKANNESKIINESLTAELERYKERVKIIEQRFNAIEKFIDSQMDDMIRMKNTKFVAYETEIDTIKQTLSKHAKEKESLLTTLNGFKTEFKERESKSIDKEIVLENKNKELENIVSQRIKLILYDGNVLSKKHDVLFVVDHEETLILAEESRLKMVEKQNDPIMKKEKINITLINYSELNKLAEYFGKRFVPQKELLLDKIISQEIVNIVLNSSVIICDSEKKNENSMDTCNKCLELEAELVKKNDVYIELSKRFSNREQHCISIEVTKQLNKENFQKDKSSDNQNHPEIQECFEQNDLKTQLQAKDTSMENANLKILIQEKVFANATLKNELRKLKGKSVIDNVVSKPHATTIAPGLFKLNLEPLASKVLKNKDAHLEYIKHSREHADILWEIVKSARALSPLDSNLDSALLVTPKNKDKKVRFADRVTSSSNTQKQVDSHKPKVSN